MVTATPYAQPGLDRNAATARQIDEAALAARAARLRYVSDTSPGIRRRRSGSGWAYTSPDGSTVRDEDTLRRIRALAIPPAWTDVWICPHANGHIQATGRDARRRKQYRYHRQWHAVRDETKYGRMVAFGRALTRIREATDADLARAGLAREKVLAAVVRLLEATLIRVGNGEYARHNDSYGLTTMRSDHAVIEGTRVKFRFRGKSGKEHQIGLRDRRLASVVRRCQELPGEELFQYVDDGGEPQTIASSDVNAYLRELSGQDFTAKDFRTWSGTVLAAMALDQLGPPATEAECKRNVLDAVGQVADALGNTLNVCRKSYVHPAVLESYSEGITLGTYLGRSSKSSRADGLLAPEEAAVILLLEDRSNGKAAA